MPEVSLPKIGRVVNLIGQTFSYLKVESYAGKIKTKTAWHCICVCGKGKIIRGNDLKKGNTKSCGCMHGPVHILHGHSRNGKRTTTYQCWTQMMERCYRPNAPSYKRYGARGIVVCERWKFFPNFLTDMGERPLGLTLDRKDNDGPYSPENCHWTTWKQQARNRRNNRFVTISGEKKMLIVWCEQRKLSYHKVHLRLRYGWTIEEALEFVPRKRPPHYTITRKDGVPFIL